MEKKAEKKPQHYSVGSIGGSNLQQEILDASSQGEQFVFLSNSHHKVLGRTDHGVRAALKPYLSATICYALPYISKVEASIIRFFVNTTPGYVCDRSLRVALYTGQRSRSTARGKAVYE